MAYFGSVRLPDGTIVELFREPDRREWRELEGAVDPVDGVRAFLVGDALYAWVPAALHRDVEPALRKRLRGARGSWLPLCIRPAVATVTVTTSLRGALPSSERARIERRVLRNRTLRMRLGDRPAILFAGELAVAA